jgi:hypothetical protein
MVTVRQLFLRKLLWEAVTKRTRSPRPAATSDSSSNKRVALPHVGERKVFL